MHFVFFGAALDTGKGQEDWGGGGLWAAAEVAQVVEAGAEADSVAAVASADLAAARPVVAARAEVGSRTERNSWKKIWQGLSNG